jgi:hypothetical protein
MTGQHFVCSATQWPEVSLLRRAVRIHVQSMATQSRLGDVMVIVLATGPKGCGFEPGQGDGFLKAIKIRSTPSSRMGSKAGGLMS